MTDPTAWPAQSTELWPVEKLVAYARTHSEAQVDQIAASIRECGWTNPILATPEGTIIAGHGRLMAARKLGIERVPVMVARGWSEAQVRAYVIADNQLALNAGWDTDLLKIEAADLSALGFDLNLLGFEGPALDALLAPAPTTGLTDEDEAPEPPGEPVSRLGDVWSLGRHRLVCGDATDPHAVAVCLDGVEPHLMVTDRPYGVEYEPEWRDKAAGKKGATGTAKGKVLNDDRADWREAWALFPGDVAYVWHGGLYAGVVGDSLRETGFVLRSQIIWAKERLILSRGDYHWQHEPCWYAVRKGRRGHYGGGRKQSTLWQIEKPTKSETGHGTQKPVECMRRPILNNSSPGQAVYEPFSGSGTTIIAGETTGRPVHAIELNPVYVDVAIARWEAFTGNKAVLEATGDSFAATAAHRRPDAA
ncbi:site-specific DNA-methyltransferase [Rubellimicrobium sp. CFH 75288]|uniref:site-specific DNA-methyltransferase n=1 Tax=Rubellimicrobium sp. CFH 75288 TaxID=2697034 RepID=UPI001413109F|nr:DNA methyltransferase [Rubellimicrobium sp. CFH 75288]NAZ37165.1 ParB N-terminal domain-containing protein [Rubellimicrobium sp. CFH 75288]